MVAVRKDRKLDARRLENYPFRPVGGRSSMVESKLVELVVAGSNPVGHPIFCFAKNAAPKRSEGGLLHTVCKLFYFPESVSPAR